MVTLTDINGPPLDFSFKGLHCLDEMKTEKPRQGMRKYKRAASGKYICTSVRLNNNLFQSVIGIHDVIHELIEQPDKLTWLDLSFNRLSSLANELTSLPNLKILYLHGNALSDVNSVLRQLKTFEGLISLTLHGNPLEERKGYRNKILLGLPQLKSLDFNNITPADRKRVAAQIKHPHSIASRF
ncbi:hypothetical protein AAG570_009735 [Ranatra chinensis]|uniref:Leucine-rich repeat-containing protein 51 n=1 Tax=Ranatra chinensis TaxID=642074 RepID=A0ABD0YQ75_9HEMI